MSLANVDLNLLTVFRAVEEARHVTRAARALGLSQPALSHALRRLRDTFGDPLFVKTPKGMAPTPRALELAGPIRSALTSIERDVMERGSFHPNKITRTFRIRTTDFLEGLYAPALLTSLQESAPGVRFASLPLGFELPKEELEAGTCDLAIAGFFGELGPSFHHAHLFDDSYACAVRKEHPRFPAHAKLTLEAYCRERHILVAPSGELTGTVDRVLREGSRRKKTTPATRSVTAGASGFLSAGWMTADSDCVLTAPSKLLRLIAERLSLRVLDAPMKMPQLRIVCVWHERNNADPGHSWFRELIRRTVA